MTPISPEKKKINSAPAKITLGMVKKVILFKFPWCVTYHKRSGYNGRLPYLTKEEGLDALIALCRASVQYYRHHMPIDKAIDECACTISPFLDRDHITAKKFVERFRPLIEPKKGYCTSRRLAELLRLTAEEREWLEVWNIGAIDRTKEQLKHDAKVRRMKREKARKQRMRLEAGVKPRGQSERRTKPWEEYGLSRATWYRRKKDGQPLPQKLSERPAVDYGDWMEEVPDVPS